MKKKQNDAIEVSNVEQVPTEIIAAAIVRLSQAAEKMLSSGLNRRGLEVLLKDTSGVPMSEIGRVLNALPRLAELYTIPKRGSKHNRLQMR